MLHTLRKIGGAFFGLPGLFVTIPFILYVFTAVRGKPVKGYLVLVIFAFFLTTGAGVRLMVTPYEITHFKPDPHAQAIVVLGGGSIYDDTYPTLILGPYSLMRLQRAFELWKEQPLPFLLSGGSGWEHEGTGEAQLMKNTLTIWGVPEDNIFIEDHSSTTWENAAFSAPIIEEKQWDKIYLVTSNIHLRRSIVAFSHFLPGRTIITVPAHPTYDRVPFTSGDLLPNPAALTATTQSLHEIAGTAVYLIRSRWTGNEVFSFVRATDPS